MDRRRDWTRPLPTTLIAVGALLAALLLLPLSSAPRAEAYVYWTNPNERTIGRADLDGSGADQSFISAGPSPGPIYGVAVDSGHVYWTNWATDKIARANLDGSGVDQTFITGAGYPYGVAVDASHLYWTNGEGSTIGRADLDGTNVDGFFIAGADFPLDVAVDAGHVYWTNGDPTNAIGRANLDGSGANQSFITGANYPWGIAVDAGHVYWANGGTNSIARADLDGTDVDLNFITGLNAAVDIAVDADHIYWTGEGIGRANLDGTDVNPGFMSGAPFEIAVDTIPGTTPPQTEITKHPSKETERSKVKFNFRSSDLGSTFECRLIRQKFEPCDSPKTLKRLKRGKHMFQVRAIDAAGNVDRSPATATFRVVG